uniref:Uncharacterized protein n=1 Tax=Ascaris lumbricoides TaxID=6252 RepID=A0A0M3IU32_ASCLU
MVFGFLQRKENVLNRKLRICSRNIHRKPQRS